MFLAMKVLSSIFAMMFCPASSFFRLLYHSEIEKAERFTLTEPALPVVCLRLRKFEREKSGLSGGLLKSGIHMVSRAM